jgi:hypothetical protein
LVLITEQFLLLVVLPVSVFFLLLLVLFFVLVLRELPANTPVTCRRVGQDVVRCGPKND